MAKADSKPKGNQALFLQDEILKRTAHIHAICRLAGEASAESAGKVLSNAMWSVECLLTETKDLVGQLGEMASGKAPAGVPVVVERSSALDGKDVDVDYEALGRDLNEIACTAIAIKRVTVNDSGSDDSTAIQALAEKAGYLADCWLPRLDRTLVVGDKFEDWMSA